MRRIAAVLFVGALAAGPAAPAVAQTPDDPLCEGTIVGDVTLDRDLACDIQVGDNTRLDLGGHHIDGTIYMDQESSEDYFLHDVEIANGSVGSIYVNYAFLRIVDLEASITMRLGDVDALNSDASFGAALLGGGSINFVGGTFRGAYSCEDNCDQLTADITGSVVDIGSYSNGSLNITDSTIVNMIMDEEGSSVSVRGSRVTGDILVHGSASFVGNEFTSASLRVVEDVIDVDLVDNSFTGTSGGVWFGGGPGDVSTPGSVDVRGNRFANSVGNGLFLLVDDTFGGGDGDEGEEPEPGVLTGTISGNRFIRNRADGLQASLPEGSDVAVAGNVAVRNGGYGMAVSGAVDGAATRRRTTAGPSSAPGWCVRRSDQERRR